MKRCIICLLIGFMLGTCLTVGAAEKIRLIVDEKEINSDVAPQIINGRVMIPARPLAEALDAEVSWDDTNKSVVVLSKKTISDKMDNTEWVDVGDLYKYNLSQNFDTKDNLVKLRLYAGEILVLETEYFEYKMDTTSEVMTNKGQIRIRPMKSSTHYSIEDLKRIGLIP